MSTGSSQVPVPSRTQARARRHDPDRRERILRATLEVIQAEGVSAVTHRRVARAADVPLGSMTYHFDGLDELLYLAFERIIERAVSRFRTALDARDDAVESLVALIQEETLAARGDLVLSIELYGLAARDPRFRGLTQRWMTASRVELERRFDPDIVPALDALIEGLVLHASLSTQPYSLEVIRDAVARATRTT